MFNYLCDRLELLWEPRDLWVGVYWDMSDSHYDIYLALVPLVILHWNGLRVVSRQRRREHTMELLQLADKEKTQ